MIWTGIDGGGFTMVAAEVADETTLDDAFLRTVNLLLQNLIQLSRDLENSLRVGIRGP